MGVLRGKIAVITGGNRRIGLAAAKRFASKGAFVFITGRRQDELDKAVMEIGKNVVAMKSDISKLDDIDRLYKEVAQKKGNRGKLELVRQITEETIPMKQTWHGHSAFRIEAGEAKIFIDSFLSDNPSRDNGWSGYLTGKNSTQGGDR